MTMFQMIFQEMRFSSSKLHSICSTVIQKDALESLKSRKLSLTWDSIIKVLTLKSYSVIQQHFIMELSTSVNLLDWPLKESVRISPKTKPMLYLLPSIIRTLANSISTIYEIQSEILEQTMMSKKLTGCSRMLMQIKMESSPARISTTLSLAKFD